MKNVFCFNKACSAIIVLSMVAMLTCFVNVSFGQAEVEPWGNITGIRNSGQLIEFESGISLVNKDWSKIQSTGKEKQRPHFKRNGDEQIMTSAIDSLFFNETVKDIGNGKIRVSIKLAAHADLESDLVYFTIKFPANIYPYAKYHLLGKLSDSLKKYFVLENRQSNPVNVNGFEVNAQKSQLVVEFKDTAAVLLKRDISQGRNDETFYIALNSSNLKKGDTLQKIFIIKASGEIDKDPINIVLNTNQQGRAFEGLGGNFRLQNPKHDPEVIDYCLKNLRIAWGRVELPWRFWQPDKNVDPIAAADSGKLHPAVKNAMVMAHRLDSMGTPIILSAWFPPNWAAQGKVNFQPVNGIWGNPLNKDNMDAIYKSIADYIQYLKTKYGVEPKYFSFNESDLGINVRVTPQEHDDFIKGCGAYFASRGFKTKMLLGDNSDATTYKFINTALDDEASHPYIGAVSFHSWRGWEKETLQKWADASTKLKLPLFVAEGSTDAAAYSYPDIFQEQTYALKEINLYVRLLAICQPASILQWQLTSDYSPLIGGGIFGNNEPLHPGQRFYNLKQLSITPKGLFAMPISSDKSDVSCAALGDNSKNVYTLHLVNNGTAREVILSGLPVKVKHLQMFTTSKKLNMEKSAPIEVENGMAKFKIAETSYITLISD